MFKNIKIVGTSHISSDSIKKIDSAFKSFNPDIVAVELDNRRFLSLFGQKQRTPPILMVKKIGLAGYFFLIIGQFIQKKLGSIVGVRPGSDMKAAVEFAKKNNLQLELIDRDIELTLKRFSKRFSFKEKVFLFKDLLFASFSKNKIRFDISKIPENELISKLLDEMKKKYPSIYVVLIEERNKFMAKKIFLIQRNRPGKKILCVIGAGHEEGLINEIKKLFQANISFSKQKII